MKKSWVIMRNFYKGYKDRCLKCKIGFHHNRSKRKEFYQDFSVLPFRREIFILTCTCLCGCGQEKSSLI